MVNFHSAFDRSQTSLWTSHPRFRGVPLGPLGVLARHDALPVSEPHLLFTGVPQFNVLLDGGADLFGSGC
jgi:hypothetical protein